MTRPTDPSGAPLTDLSHWAATWKQIDHSAVSPDATFDPVLGKLLTRDESLTALEVGCYPANYMAYLSERFGYRVSGVDFMNDVTALRAPLEAAGVKVDELIQADFLSWVPRRKWNVVASFGFVEHFKDLGVVLDKHLECLAPGGKLVIEVPHFRGAQYLLRRAFQPRLLDSHNLEAMRPAWYRTFLEGRGLRVLHCDYFRTFEFWISPSGPQRRFELLNRVVNVASRTVQKGLARAGLESIPNRWLSPYVVVVAEKPSA